MKIIRVLSAFVLVFLLFAAGLTGLQSQPQRAGAQIDSETVVTLFNGGTGFTQTVTSTAQTSAYYRKAILQVHGAVSGTGNITVTPQFSNERGECTNARYWYPVIERTTYLSPTGGNTGTTSLVTSESNVVIYLTDVVTSSTGDTVRVFDVYGRCVRAVVASSSDRYTTTLYLRMVNDW